ncbi:MAG TPA: GNAT family N-acetyltransferase [Iamia sp.]|nr:GNAT family N-acetyltransferase [Iamia sp.]
MSGTDAPLPPRARPWPADHEPTLFQRAVVTVVAGLRPGELMTYGEVAEEIGRPGAGQAVANVLRSAPDLPWWRVLPGDGRVYRSHAPAHVPLLVAEGHRVDEHRRVHAGTVGIRPATADDATAVGVLTEKVYRDGGYLDDDEAYVAQLLDGAGRVRDAVVLVAELAGTVVASVTVAEPGTPWAEIARPDELEVRMLAVAETARRRGIADRLMDEVEAHARRRGLAAVVLSTEPAMTGAHVLYERRGYVRHPERDWDVDGFPLIAYRLALA